MTDSFSGELHLQSGESIASSSITSTVASTLRRIYVVYITTVWLVAAPREVRAEPPLLQVDDSLVVPDTDRLFTILPNGLTVEAGTDLPPLRVKQTFTFSNLYRPASDRTARNTAIRVASQVLWDAVGYECREFCPDIRRWLEGRATNSKRTH
jgi:hypothetical protein